VLSKAPEASILCRTVEDLVAQPILLRDYQANTRPDHLMVVRKVPIYSLHQ
jgi:hypothetical protein